MMTRMRTGKLYVRRGIQTADIKYFFIASCFQSSKFLLPAPDPAIEAETRPNRRGSISVNASYWCWRKATSIVAASTVRSLQ